MTNYREFRWFWARTGPEATPRAGDEHHLPVLTDRNQKLAKVEGARASAPDGRNILWGTVTLDYRATERTMVVNLPGQGLSTFRLRLPANGGTVTSEIHDAFAIRYRVR